METIALNLKVEYLGSLETCVIVDSRQDVCTCRLVVKDDKIHIHPLKPVGRFGDKDKYTELRIKKNSEYDIDNDIYTKLLIVHKEICDKIFFIDYSDIAGVIIKEFDLNTHILDKLGFNVDWERVNKERLKQFNDETYKHYEEIVECDGSSSTEGDDRG